MLSTKEKAVAEKFIELHKNHGGTVSHDTKFNFAKSLSNSFYDMNPIISKLIALNLIEYTLSNMTGMTSLTKQGWDFKTFNDHERMLQSQNEIDQITIEKLKVDLRNSKRQAKMFWPLTILTILLGTISIFYSFNSSSNNSYIKLEQRIQTADSAINSLEKEMKLIRSDTSGVNKND